MAGFNGMPRLAFDIETYCPLDLRRVGAWRQSIHPQSDVLCATMTDEDGRCALRWRPGHPAPTFAPGTILTGYNVLGFDAIWWLHVLTPRYGWPWPGFQAFEDTMHAAAYGNLPGRLGEVAKALGTAPKDDAGHDLMMYLCKPAPALKDDADPRRHHTVENIERLTDYCVQDTIAENQVRKKLPKLPAFECKVASLDAEINRRGIQVDLDLISRLTTQAELISDDLRAELDRITDGAVKTERQHEPLRQWLRAHGVPVLDGKGSMDKEAIGDLLELQTWPDDVDRVLNLRLMLNKSSLAKLEKMAECVDPRDQRIHGLLQYYGAHQTGRWAGRLVQPQNLPRGVIEDADEYERALWFLKHAPLSFAQAYGDDAMDVLSSLIRCCFVPSPGNLLVCADYSAIEARVLAWLAGEEWRLEVFRTHGKIYEASASKAFGVALDKVTKKLRSGGKVLELACGFGGSVGALRRFGAVKKYGMTEASLKPNVTAWREASPNIVQHWYDLENAAMSSLRRPGTVHPVGDKGVKFGFDGRHLRMQLPSGRELYYRNAWIGKKAVPWSDTPKDAIMFWGEDDNHRWCQQDTYGGRLSENDTSAASRDLLAEAMVRVDAAGIPIVMSVHDELIAEMPIDKADPDELCRLMSILPPWAKGLPVTATGWAGSFYRK